MDEPKTLRAEELSRWRTAGFDPRQALLWRRAQFDPESARLWVKAGITDERTARSASTCGWTPVVVVTVGIADFRVYLRADVRADVATRIHATGMSAAEYLKRLSAAEYVKRSDGARAPAASIAVRICVLCGSGVPEGRCGCTDGR